MSFADILEIWQHSYYFVEVRGPAMKLKCLRAEIEIAAVQSFEGSEQPCGHLQGDPRITPQRLEQR